MGTFGGHIDEGILFLMLGFWWMYNMFRDYRQAIRSGQPYRSRISYATKIGKRHVPCEIYLKIAFTALAFVLEIFANGLPVEFVDENNRYKRLQNLQHMTIYGLFFIHGITDLLSYHKVSPLMREMKYITAVVAFFWYGTQFFYHSSESLHKPPLENMIHRLPIPTIVIMTSMFIWEMKQRETITPQIVRCLGIMILGTWFFHISFILYVPVSLFKSHQNPAWDGHDMRNVHFVTALYGFHIMFNICVMLVVYGLVSTGDRLVKLARRVMGRKDSNFGCEYRKLDSDEQYHKQSMKCLVDELQLQDSAEDELCLI